VKLTPWTPSDAHAVDLVALVQRAEGKVLEVLVAELRADEGRNPEVTPAAPASRGHAHVVAHGGWHADTVASTMARVRATLDRWLSPALVSEVVTSSGERARTASEKHWAAEVSRAAGQDVALNTTVGRELLQAWIAENTARIQGLRNETLERIRADIETAFLSDARPQELAAKWEREGLPTRNGTLRGRATVIARDQLGTLAAQLAEQQQRALGIVRYTWDPMPALRRKHRAVHLNRAGAVYSWDSPPPGGHPGHAVGCGCRAVAVIDAGTLRQRLR
jgi:hypothetical protein